jgi:putative ABC transport system permease protein
MSSPAIADSAVRGAPSAARSAAPRRGRMGLLGMLREALWGLASHRLRAVIATFGMAVGVATVLLVTSGARSASSTVFRELETFGLRSVWVQRDAGSESPLQQGRSGSGLPLRTPERLRDCCPSLLRMSFVMSGNSSGLMVQYGAKQTAPRVLGVDANYMAVSRERLAVGRALTELDVSQAAHVAVIGAPLANEVFGDAGRALGSSMYLGDTRLRVVGVLEEADRSFLRSVGSYTETDASFVVLLPYSRLTRMTGAVEFDRIGAEARSLAQAEAGGEELSRALRTASADRYAFRAETMRGQIETARRILDTMTWMGALGAIGSLLVAGLGVFNLVSTGVRERTREIGLRIALGARPRQVQAQFLAEAAIVALFGAVLGTAAAWSIAHALASMVTFSLVPDPRFILLAWPIGVAVGLMAAYLPARTAGRLDPARSLKYE